MKATFVVPIVEGNGEVNAVPCLLSRIAEASTAFGHCEVSRPIRIRADRFRTNGDDRRRHVELAARRARSHPRGMVLLLLDSEDVCPAQAGQTLQRELRAVRADVPYLVVLAYREFETWFLAAARSLRGCCGLLVDLLPPDAPERIRDAKGWLSDRMPNGYDPVVHQLELTCHFSLDEACTVPSFARFRRRFEELVARL